MCAALAGTAHPVRITSGHTTSRIDGLILIDTASATALAASQYSSQSAAPAFSVSPKNKTGMMRRHGMLLDAS
jgi:hypothetical protein